MKCDTKTMIKLGAGLGLALVAAYFMFPAFQTFILRAAPFLILLICPLSMFFMLRRMESNPKEPPAECKSGTTALRKPINELKA